METRNERIAAAVSAINNLEFGELSEVMSSAADGAFAAGSELESAWQDRPGSSRWNQIGKVLASASDRIAKLESFS